MHHTEQPSPVQLASLQRYANHHGKHWRWSLANAWDAGADIKGEDGPLLRQVRNGHGKGWLYSRHNPIRPKSA